MDAVLGKAQSTQILRYPYGNCDQRVSAAIKPTHSPSFDGTFGVDEAGCFTQNKARSATRPHACQHRQQIGAGHRAQHGMWLDRADERRQPGERFPCQRKTLGHITSIEQLMQHYRFWNGSSQRTTAEQRSDMHFPPCRQERSSQLQHYTFTAASFEAR
ncbi:hypothetical protein GCM10027021_08830 [Dyella kyungheensis]